MYRYNKVVKGKEIDFVSISLYEMKDSKRQAIKLIREKLMNVPMVFISKVYMKPMPEKKEAGNDGHTEDQKT